MARLVYPSPCTRSFSQHMICLGVSPPAVFGYPSVFPVHDLWCVKSVLACAQSRIMIFASRCILGFRIMHPAEAVHSYPPAFCSFLAPMNVDGHPLFLFFFVEPTCCRSVLSWVAFVELFSLSVKRILHSYSHFCFCACVTLYPMTSVFWILPPSRPSHPATTGHQPPCQTPTFLDPLSTSEAGIASCPLRSQFCSITDDYYLTVP